MLSYIHNELRPKSHYFQRTPEQWGKVRQSQNLAAASDQLVKCSIAALHEAVGVVPKLITGTASNRLKDHGALCPPPMKMSLQSLGALGAVNVALCYSAGFVGSALCAIVGAPAKVAMGLGQHNMTAMHLARQGWYIGAEFGRVSVGCGVFVIAEALRNVLRLWVKTVLNQSVEVCLSSYKNIKVFSRQIYNVAEQAMVELNNLPSPGACAAGMRR